MNWENFGEFEDIHYHKGDGVAKVTINRPHKRNAFRPKTVSEMYEAFRIIFQIKFNLLIINNYYSAENC